MSYLIPISLFALKRIRGEPIEFGPFTLGKFGLAINLYAIAFGIFICIWLPFPAATPATAASMNWAGPVFGFLFVIALIDWFVRGRKHYAGPTKEATITPIESKEPSVDVIHSTANKAM